jgi:hypothetical protein
MWEVEMEGSWFKARSGKKLMSSYLKKKKNWAWRYTSVIPAVGKMEVRRLCPGSVSDKKKKKKNHKTLCKK